MQNKQYKQYKRKDKSQILFDKICEYILQSGLRRYK